MEGKKSSWGENDEDEKDGRKERGKKERKITLLDIFLRTCGRKYVAELRFLFRFLLPPIQYPPLYLKKGKEA